ncbi:MAG: hemolysin family protein [Anaerolineales bacterium]
MSDPFRELLLIFFLLFLHSLLSMTETALLSLSKARLQGRLGEDRSNKYILNLLENPNRFLSAIQVGITLTDLLMGAIGGATLASYLEVSLQNISWLAPYRHSLALAVIVLIITYLSLVLGELVPKRLGLTYNERIARWMIVPMRLFLLLFAPLVRFLSFSTDLFLRLLGIHASEEQPVTEEEIRVLLDQGTQAGVFEESEQEMVSGVFQLHDQRVYSLMTPRSEIVWLDVQDSIEEIKRKILESPFSRFPVCRDDLDNVLGIVKARDLLRPLFENRPIRLEECIQPITFIPETTLASRALEIFKENGREMLLVVNEFGSVQGLITLNDLLSEIVGELGGEEAQAIQRQDGSWLLDGMLPVDDFKELFSLPQLPHEEEYETLGGFIMTMLGRIPQVADRLEWRNLRFEIMDMDGRRVDKVLVTTMPKQDSTS